MYLLTGCNGFIGSYIARQLLSEGKKIRALKRIHSDLSLVADIAGAIEWVEGDLLDVLALRKAMSNIEYVIHAAAFVSVNGMSSRDEKEMFRVNIEGTANVVNACMETGVKRLCHISTVAAIGERENRSDGSITENATWEPEGKGLPYGESKQLAEREVWRGAAEGLSVCVVNPSVVLGQVPASRSSGRIFQYIWDEPAFYPPGAINIVDVRDVAKAALLLLQSPNDEERFILNAATMPYSEFCAQVARRLGKRPPQRSAPRFGMWLAYALGQIWAAISRKPALLSRGLINTMQKSNRFDSSKIRKTTGFEFRPVEETLDWVCSYYRTSLEKGRG